MGSENNKDVPNNLYDNSKAMRNINWNNHHDFSFHFPLNSGIYSLMNCDGRLSESHLTGEHSDRKNWPWIITLPKNFKEFPRNADWIEKPYQQLISSSEHNCHNTRRLVIIGGLCCTILQTWFFPIHNFYYRMPRNRIMVMPGIIAFFVAGHLFCVPTKLMVSGISRIASISTV